MDVIDKYSYLLQTDDNNKLNEYPIENVSKLYPKLNLEDLNDVCRGCMGVFEHRLYLYHGELSQQFFECTNLQISRGDGFPEYICLHCHSKILQFSDFKNLCMKSHTIYLQKLNLNKELSGLSNNQPNSDNHKSKEDEKHYPNFETNANFVIPEADAENESTVESEDKFKDESTKYKKKSGSMKILKCKTCKKSFRSQIWLKKHYRTHMTDRGHLLKNSACDKKKKLMTKILPCTICGKNLRSEKSLRLHMQIHNENRNEYYCNICNKHFRQLASFKVHQQIHNGQKRCVCHICGLAFQEQNMKVHLLRHNKVRNYSCKICCKSFVLSIELKTHELRHQKIRKFPCSHCDKSFYTKRELDRHISSHSDVKPYQCNICDKAFKSDSYLIVHKRSHTGERPYGCEFCEQTFKRGKDLRNHRMRHTGERPYKCQLCNKAFIQKTPLNRHLQAHAKNHLPCNNDGEVTFKDTDPPIPWLNKL